MTFTISHPDGTETSATEDAVYYDSESKTVYTNQRRRSMPQYAKFFVPDEWYITSVEYQGDLVGDYMAPPQLEDAPRGEFVIRDETGAKVKIRAVRDEGVLA